MTAKNKDNLSELDLLRKENELLRKQKDSRLNQFDASSRFAKEMSDLQRTSSIQTHSLPAKTIDDHRNVSIYHTNGRQVGKEIKGLHPANAIAVANMWLEKGVILSTKKPSEEYIAEYKDTDEYKKLNEAFMKDRERKSRKKSSGDIEKLASLLGVKAQATIKTGV